MSNEKAWDPDEVYSPKYANEFTMDLAAGLNASDVLDTSTWVDAWHLGADSIFRYYKDGKLLRVKTPEPGISMELLGQLSGVEIVADDIVRMSFEMDSDAVVVAVNDRTVAYGARRSDGGCEWWASDASAKLSE
jgi:hypothetical protein